MIKQILIVIFCSSIFLASGKVDTTGTSAMATKAYENLGKNADKVYFYATKVKSKTKTFKRCNAYNKANLVLAIYHQELSNVDSSLFYLKGILDNAEYLDKNLVVRVYIQLGIIERMRGYLSESTQFFSKAYEQTLLTNNLKLNFYSQFQLASNYHTIGRYADCVDLSKAALTEMRNANFKRDTYKNYFYNAIGIAYNEIDPLQAQPYFDSVLHIAISKADSAAIYMGYNNTANSLYLSGALQQAKEYFLNVLTWAAKSENIYTLAAVNVNLGNVSLGLNDSLNAISFYKEGLAYSYQCQNIDFIRNAYLGLTNVGKGILTESEYYEVYDSFLTYQEKILEFNKEQNVSKINYYKDLADERLIQKELLQENMLKDKRLLWQGLFLGLTVLIAFIIGTFWFKLKKQIKLNKQQSADLKLINKDLMVLGQKKDQMLSILGHDLRGPLQNIIYLNNEFINSSLNEKLYKKMLKDITEKTQNTADMIDGLLLWANTFLSAGLKFTNCNAADALNQVIEQLKFKIEKKNLELILKLEDVVLSTDLQTFQIVFRNLLSNAIKFTPANKRVEVTAKVNGGLFSIQIIDQGKGFDLQVLSVIQNANNNKIQSTKGTDGEKGSGVGLKLSLEFAKMINGSIDVLNTSTLGSTVQFSVPLQQD